jgi:hypothetical protein
VDWIYLAQGKLQWHALVNMVMNLQVLGQLSANIFSRRTLPFGVIIQEKLPWMKAYSSLCLGSGRFQLFCSAVHSEPGSAPACHMSCFLALVFSYLAHMYLEVYNLKDVEERHHLK